MSTQKLLEAKIERLNNVLWKDRSTIVGKFELYRCVGVFALHQVVTEGRAVHNWHSCRTARELMLYVDGVLDGYIKCMGENWRK